NFDTTTVLCEAKYQPVLMATIEAVVPHCKYRSGYMRGFLRDRPLRAVLTALAEQHFDTDEYGWWRLRADEHSNGTQVVGPGAPRQPGRPASRSMLMQGCRGPELVAVHRGQLNASHALLP